MRLISFLLLSFYLLNPRLTAQIEPDEACPAEWIALTGVEGTSGSGCGDFSVVSFVADLKDGECEGVGPCHILEPAYVDIEYVGSSSASQYEVNMIGSIYPPPPPNQNNIFHVRIYGDSPCNDIGSSLVVRVGMYLLTGGGPFLVCTAWNTMVCNQCQEPNE